MQFNWITILAAIVFAVQLTSTGSASVNKRHKRAAYELSDGVDQYLGEIRTTFRCPGDGYYGDLDNDCKLFHVCITHTKAEGGQQQDQWTFACGNTTVFNQFSMTCAHEDEAVPCRSSPDFYYLNELLYAGPDTPLHQEQDVERAQLYYGGRTGGGNGVAARASNRPTGADREADQ
ncbi:hypothetical protein HDE_11806 [Halotydeus destructor]|nr:hypothetical protein HDE_11806 [Halotydeus destructor]